MRAPQTHLDSSAVVSVGELRSVKLPKSVLHVVPVAEVHDASAPVVHVGIIHISCLQNTRHPVHMTNATQVK